MRTTRTAPAATPTASPARRPSRSDKELPLIQDIRLLGRLLGDVIREHEGTATYELVERIRTLSVAFRRDADQRAGNTLRRLSMA